jgi:hypothetical protein
VEPKGSLWCHKSPPELTLTLLILIFLLLNVTPYQLQINLHKRRGSAHVGTSEKAKLWSLLAPMRKLVALYKDAIDGKVVMFIVTSNEATERGTRNKI